MSRATVYQDTAFVPTSARDAETYQKFVAEENRPTPPSEVDRRIAIYEAQKAKEKAEYERDFVRINHNDGSYTEMSRATWEAEQAEQRAAEAKKKATELQARRDEYIAKDILRDDIYARYDMTADEKRTVNTWLLKHGDIESLEQLEVAIMTLRTGGKL
jgi:hypothetical protein